MCGAERGEAYRARVDEETMRTRIDAARVARFASVTPEGRPHIVPCCFIREGDTVWSAVDAKPKTTLALRRLENLRLHSAVSLLVDHYEENWDRLWWIRLDGEAQVLTGSPARDEALDALATKYPHYVGRRPPGAVIAVTVTRWRSWP